MAMGKPIIPVPGMPTPIAFLRMFALKRTSIFSGRDPSNSQARATHKATAMGSVHPIAGTTSRFMRAMTASRSVLDNMVYSFCNTKIVNHFQSVNSFDRYFYPAR